MSTTASWVGPTVAVALVVIALAFIAIALFTVKMLMVASKETRELSEELSKLRSELQPALEGIRKVADATSAVTGKVHTEIDEYLAASRRFRRGLERGARRARGRLADLESLYEVVHGEVEHSALDVASRLRSLRRGGGMITQVRRMLRRGRR
jgi:biopolymer transport protein ExbB/TolQ